MPIELVGHTDVCVDGTRVWAPWGSQTNADGTVTRAPAEVHVAAPGQPVRVVAVPTRAIYLSAERLSTGVLVVAWASQDDDGVACYWRSDTDVVTPLERVNGQYPVLVTPDGCIYYFPASGGGRSYLQIGPDGSKSQPIPCSLTSQCFAGYDGSNQPILRDRIPLQVLGGVTFAPGSYRHRDWTFGGDTHANRLVAYHWPTQAAYVVCQTDSQIKPQGRTLSDGSAVIAISVPGQFVESAKFQTLADAPPPPVVVPTSFPTMTADVVVIGDHASARQVCVYGQDTVTPQTRVVFVTVGAQDVDAAAALAKSAGVPLVAYVDDPTYVASRAPIRSDVHVIPCVQAYPIGTKAQLQASLQGLKDAGFTDLAECVPGYRQTHGDGTFSWSTPQVIQTLVDDVAAGKAFNVRLFVVFCQSRGTDDGLDHQPELASTIRVLRSACIWPLPSPVMPVPDESVVPTPDAEPSPEPTVTVGDGQVVIHASAPPAGVAPDDPGFVYLGTQKVWFGADAEKVRALQAAQVAAFQPAVADQGVPPAGTPPPSAVTVVQPWHVDGPVFRRPDGGIERFMGVSLFTLMQKMRAGVDVRPIVRQRRSLGFTVGRVFCQFRFMNWPQIDAFIATPDEIRACGALLLSEGMRGEFTILADCENDTGDGYTGFNQSLDDRAARVQSVLGVLAGTPHLSEMQNEPLSNGGLCVETATAAGLFTSRPIPMALGLYPITGDEANFPCLDYISDHPPRKPNWTTEAGKIGVYVFRQTGRAWVGGEWSKFTQVGNPDGEGDEFDPVESPRRAEEGAGGCALAGAGFTFHSVQGIHADLLTDLELTCARRAVAAMQAIPVDMPLGEYTHDGMANCPLAPVNDVSIVGEVSGRIASDGTHAMLIGADPTPRWNPVGQNGWRIVDRKYEVGQLVVLER